MGLTEETILEFSIGGYPGPFFNVRVKNDVLICRQGWEKQDDVVVSLEIRELPEWELLLEFLATRKWKAEYIDENVLDGTHWELTVHTPAIHIDSTGSNAQPPGFKKMMRLLNMIMIRTGIQIY